jgi:acyl carrier protein
MTTIDETIRSVLKAHGRLAVDPETLGETVDLYTSGLSSHSSVNVMLALENEFDLEFPDEMLTKATFQSISTVREALEKMGVHDGA